MSSEGDAQGDRLKYLRNNEIRAEIVYAVGGDPSPFDREETYCIRKADLVRIATAVADLDEPAQLTIRGLYDAIDDAVPAMDHYHNAGNTWGITREDLKAIHRAVDGRPPKQIVSDGGVQAGSHPVYQPGRCGRPPTDRARYQWALARALREVKDAE